MYIELWQLAIPIVMGITAYFTWNKAHTEGYSAGMAFIILDLSSKGVVKVAHSSMSGEIVVGRYDDDLDAEVADIEDEYFNDGEL